MGAGISEGGPPGAHEIVGRALQGERCFQCLKSSNIPEKIILNLQGIWSTFIFGLFFNARVIQKIDG